MVYFIKAGEFIKIGYTSSTTIKGRLGSLQSGYPTPLTVLGVMDGLGPTEMAVHDLLAKHRVSGEWFSACACIRSFIKAHCSKKDLKAAMKGTRPYRRDRFIPAETRKAWGLPAHRCWTSKTP